MCSLAASLAAGGALGESQLQEVLDAMQGLAGGSSRCDFCYTNTAVVA